MSRAKKLRRESLFGEKKALPAPVYVMRLDRLDALHVRRRFSIDVEVYGVPQLTAGTLMDAATRFVPIDAALLLPTKR